MSEFTERLSGTVPPNGDKEVNVKGATKSYFMHYSCVVIYFFKTTGLSKSAFSTFISGNQFFVCLCFLFIVSFEFDIIFIELKHLYIIIFYISAISLSVILFSLYKNSLYYTLFFNYKNSKGYICQYKCQGVYLQNQPSRGVLKKKCSEYIQQIYRRTPMSKCDFNEVAQQTY